MKIKYNRGSTPCPHKVRDHGITHSVGSVCCKNCSSFVALDPIHDEVECDFVQTKYCRNCGTFYTDNEHCPTCGVSVVYTPPIQSNVTCPVCGTISNPGSERCQYCGELIATDYAISFEDELIEAGADSHRVNLNRMHYINAMRYFKDDIDSCNGDKYGVDKHRF